jgi:2-polyprenyl-3-methyl-5-hydroxy-6-metoxy-1,4-benzoquinol methylase
VGLDINERYLEMARARHVGTFDQADLTVTDLSSLGTFDTILVNSFLHHVSDDHVRRILDRLVARLAPEGRVHVLELVLPPRLSLARVMAKLDRGRFARSIESWTGLFNAAFEPLVTEPYTFGGGLWAMIYLQGRVRR